MRLRVFSVGRVLMDNSRLQFLGAMSAPRVKCIGRFAGSLNNMPHFQVGLQSMSQWTLTLKSTMRGCERVPCLRGPSSSALKSRYQCLKPELQRQRTTHTSCPDLVGEGVLRQPWRSLLRGLSSELTKRGRPATAGRHANNIYGGPQERVAVYITQID